MATTQPGWYHPGDIVATVRDAEQTGRVSTREIADVLGRWELEASRDRIYAMVESTRNQGVPDDTSPERTLDEPRALESRFVDVTDVAYLHRRDFATVLGLILTRYDGTFRTVADDDDTVIDLLWNRQHTTVGLKTTPRPPGVPIEQREIATIVDGDTTPTVGRSPSTLGLVSNAGITDAAREYANDHEIRLFDAAFLTRWLAETHLTPAVLGTVVDNDDLDPDECAALLETLPPLPAPVSERDPLADRPDEVWSGSDDGRHVKTTATRPIPVAERRPSAGEIGVLYADPADDGDYGAFDRLLTEFGDDE